MTELSASTGSSQSAAIASTRRTSRTRRIGFIVSGIAAILILGYLLFATLFLNVDGTWYGVGTFKGSGLGTLRGAVYLDLHQSLSGQVSGTGTLCIRGGGPLLTTPLSVIGSTSLVAVQLKVMIGTHPDLAANGVQVSGVVQNGHFVGSNTSSSTMITLNMQHGTPRDFQNTCRTTT